MTDTMERRAFLTNALAGAGVLVSGLAMAPKAAKAKAPVVPPKCPRAIKLEALCLPYRVGQEVTHGLVIDAITVDAEQVGIVRLTGADGQKVRVDVCRRDDACPGITNTTHYSVYLRNGGKGDTATDEAQGQVVMRIGEAIRRNEAQAKTLALMTKREFWARSQGA